VVLIHELIGERKDMPQVASMDGLPPREIVMAVMERQTIWYSHVYHVLQKTGLNRLLWFVSALHSAPTELQVASRPPTPVNGKGKEAKNKGSVGPPLLKTAERAPGRFCCSV
jgi:hypothetical protein